MQSVRTLYCSFWSLVLWCCQSVWLVERPWGHLTRYSNTYPQEVLYGSSFSILFPTGSLASKHLSSARSTLAQFVPFASWGDPFGYAKASFRKEWGKSSIQTETNTTEQRDQTSRKSKTVSKCSHNRKWVYVYARVLSWLWYLGWTQMVEPPLMTLLHIHRFLWAKILKQIWVVVERMMEETSVDKQCAHRFAMSFSTATFNASKSD